MMELSSGSPLGGNGVSEEITLPSALGSADGFRIVFFGESDLMALLRERGLLPASTG